MSKLISKAKSSKLSESINNEEEKLTSKESVIRKIRPKELPRSYRFSPEIMNTLQESINRINKEAPKKVTEARFVRALIVLSRDINPQKILQAIKETW